MSLRVPATAALVAAALVLAAEPASAPAAPPAAAAMVLIRQAATLAITSGTGNDPLKLKLRCVARAPLIARCAGSWHDRSDDYAGTFIAVDETDSITALFAGTKTGRRCVKRHRPGARRQCREGVSF